MLVNHYHGRYAHWWLDRCFVYVGRMDFSKGIVEICAAWLRLREQLGEICPPLWLVGGEPEEIESVRNAIGVLRLARHEASGKVKWWGYLDSAGISTLLLKAYVLVMHSQYEPGGRVVLEAMAQGIPVIASPHGFALDLIENWHGGFIVRYGDNETLRRRMEHFIAQPLLRHAMGAAARASAHAALRRWNFIESHLSAYDRAASGKNEESISGEANTGSPGNHYSRQPPRHFDGVFPFEAENIERRDVQTFASSAIADAHDLTEAVGWSGRSRLWTFRGGGRRWIVKYPNSTYSVRPLWDRGYRGEIAEYLRNRINGEMLGATCDGAAQVDSVDRDLGLCLRRWMEPADCAGQALDSCMAALKRYHMSEGRSAERDAVSARINRDWQDVTDEQVLSTLSQLNEEFKADNRSYHAWQPMSLRLNWRWLEIGLGNGWLKLPADLPLDVGASIRAEKEVARSERGLHFGWNHGDVTPEHLRLTEEGAIALIDCERTFPGYWGYDVAKFTWGLLDRQPSDDRMTLLGKLNDTLSSLQYPRRLVRSWLLWMTLSDLCRANGLIDEDGSACCIRRLDMLRTVEIQAPSLLSP